MEKEYSINGEIDAQNVNLVLLDGSIKESIQLSEALEIGEREGVDVVEVSKGGDIDTPTCKLMDYGKMMYKQSKKIKSNKKQIQHTKEIKYGMNIDPHDLETKHNKIFKFLEKKYIVRYNLELSGRQKNMLEAALDAYKGHLEAFGDMATWKEPKISSGKRILISTTLTPL